MIELVHFSSFFKYGASTSHQSLAVLSVASIYLRVFDFLTFFLSISSYWLKWANRFFSRSLSLLTELGRTLEFDVSLEKLVDVLLVIIGSRRGFSKFLSLLCFMKLITEDSFFLIYARSVLEIYWFEITKNVWLGRLLLRRGGKPYAFQQERTIFQGASAELRFWFQSPCWRGRITNENNERKRLYILYNSVDLTEN